MQPKQSLVLLLGIICLSCSFFACEKATEEPSIHFQYKFDADQERLNNFGLESTMPTGNAGQNPDFKGMSVHYIELAPSAFTALGKGAIVYKGTETSKGGDNAVDFSKALVSDGSAPFLSISRKDLAAGTYEWVRISVTYQTYDILFNIKNVPVLGDLNQQKARIASFVGFNTYIEDLKLKEKMISVNDDKLQGFWAFETILSPPYSQYSSIESGDGVAGATTVVNPLFDSSPIPPGSCVVTGKLADPLVITGNETEDLTVELAFSINKSFEWKDSNGNGQLDFYADQPANNEQIVDMGLRGLKVYVK